MEDKTSLFDVSIIKKKLISTTLKEVFDALKERGYNPINQIVGYIISGDLGYISSYKGIRKESLRDNMTDIEVALTDLGEIATRELAKEHKPYGLKENKKIAKLGGHAAKVARDDIEKNLGKTIISNNNSLNYKYIENKGIK